jgi:hypothetical protein
MNIKEMEQRKENALKYLQQAINQLGPITDRTRISIREPILDIIDFIYKGGEELKKLDFGVYDEKRSNKSKM